MPHPPSRSLLSNVDVVIFPAKSGQSTSMTCLQAMAAGKVVVVAQTSGLTDIVLHDHCGVVIQPTTERLIRAEICRSFPKVILYRNRDSMFLAMRAHCGRSCGGIPFMQLFRYKEQIQYTWPKMRLHCGRIPLEVRKGTLTYQSDLRVKHYGWADSEDIPRKHRLYSKHHDDPHLRSVLAPMGQIRLERWVDGKVLPL